MNVQSGDRVRIQFYSEQLNGTLGTVDRVDGQYVYVFPDIQPNNNKYPIELYPREVTKLNTFMRV